MVINTTINGQDYGGCCGQFQIRFGFLRIHLVKDETAGLVHTLTTPKTYRRTS